MLFPTQVRVRCFKGRLDPPKKSPGYFSVRSLRRPKFNFHLPQASFHPHAPLVGYFSKRGNLCSVSGARVQYVLNKKVDFRFPPFCQFPPPFFSFQRKKERKNRLLSCGWNLRGPLNGLAWALQKWQESTGCTGCRPQRKKRRGREDPPNYFSSFLPLLPKSQTLDCGGWKGKRETSGFWAKTLCFSLFHL